ncbi:MAG: hypothetical protein E7Z67_02890 [Thermoplasmata archaeon]|nr:hypothetical protein [Thermoplasmata archaeon]
MKYAEGTAIEFETELKYSGGMPVQVVRFTNEMDVLSSASYYGGRVITKYVVFAQVPKDYDCSDFEGDMSRMLNDLDLPKETVVFLTAAEVEFVFTVEEGRYGTKSEFAVVTAGLSNQVIAGDELLDWESRHALSLERSEALYHPGTINIMSIFHEELDFSAKVNAVIATTEAKTAAMNILGYKETGTTSDAVAIASPRGDSCFFAGTGSSHGIAAARAVRSGVCKALIKRNDFPVDMDENVRMTIRKEYGF